MKRWIGLFFALGVLVCGGGCAIDGGYVPRVPHKARNRILEYRDLPENKVLVFAIDPNGAFAYGYDSGAKTIQSAALAATARCNSDRAVKGVIGKSMIYAVNNKVVFADMVRRNAE